MDYKRAFRLALQIYENGMHPLDVPLDLPYKCPGFQFKSRIAVNLDPIRKAIAPIVSQFLQVG